ncbi:MAG TPA: YbjN domain-containing protein [Clostridiaceae bacterium]|nr:YbjN domain-containing protein [Clostridiaceae bacterium]
MSKKIVFYTHTVDIVEAELTDIKLSHKDGRLYKVTLDISVDYDTYEIIKTNGFFHLTFDVVPDTVDFKPDKDVIITLKADPMLVQTLGELGDDEAVNQVIIAEDEAGEIIRKDINWYALRVVQEVDLPEGLDEKGSVVEGFETVYAFEDEEETESVELNENMENLIDEFRDIEYILKKYEMPYIRTGNEFSGTIDYKGHKLTYFIYETARVFVMSTAYTFFVPEENYDKACREIARINSELTVGNFDLDMEEGVLSFRTYIDVGDEILIPELFERMLIGNIATAGKYYTDIYDAVRLH